MEIEVRAWLMDIQQAIAEIREFLPSSVEYVQFREDIKTKRAIERDIEICTIRRAFRSAMHVELLMHATGSSTDMTRSRMPLSGPS